MVSAQTEHIQTAPGGRARALVEMVFVSLTWATTFVFVKIALENLGPLTIAGGRYMLGFVCLLPFMAGRNRTRQRLSRGLWVRLLALGMLSYTIGNAAAFWALKFLPATTAALLMSGLPMLVLLGSLLWLREEPTLIQIAGLVVAVGGGLLFFASDPDTAAPDWRGLPIMMVALLAFAGFSVLGRAVARSGAIDTLQLTAIPLGLGGGLAVIVALLVEGVPPLAWRGWGMVLVLAVLNTAIGYMTYNHALRTLTALESSIILNFTPLGTALFAWVLLGESLLAVQLAGVAVVILGVMLVQLKRMPRLMSVETMSGTD